MLKKWIDKIRENRKYKILSFEDRERLEFGKIINDCLYKEIRTNERGIIIEVDFNTACKIKKLMLFTNASWYAKNEKLERGEVGKYDNNIIVCEMLAYYEKQQIEKDDRLFKHINSRAFK